MEIIPGILEKDWNEIEKRIELIRPFAKTIHIDILDGKFAPNTTLLDPAPFKKYANDFLLEVHFMVEEPINYLKSFAGAGFKRFMGHVEKMSDQEEFVAQGQLLGEVGLVVDGQTPFDGIRVPLDDLDCLLFMTINAGFSGQAFDIKKLEKIKTARLKTAIPIEVDGGINDQTIKLVKDAGANRFISTSFLFGAIDPKVQYKKLQKAIQ